MRTNTSRVTIKFGALAVILWLLFSLAWAVGILYAIVHFTLKYW